MKLFYYITSLLICQVLFSSFFKFFRDVRCRFLCSNSFIISLLFQFVKYFFHFFPFSNLLFCDTSASAFLRQLSYYITSKQVCQYLFRNFFSAPVNFFSLSPDKLPSVPVSTLSFDSFIIISLFL